MVANNSRNLSTSLAFQNCFLGVCLFCLLIPNLKMFCFPLVLWQLTMNGLIAHTSHFSALLSDETSNTFTHWKVKNKNTTTTTKTWLTISLSCSAQYCSSYLQLLRNKQEFISPAFEILHPLCKWILTIGVWVYVYIDEHGVRVCLCIFYAHMYAWLLVPICLWMPTGGMLGNPHLLWNRIFI